MSEDIVNEDIHYKRNPELFKKILVDFPEEIAHSFRKNYVNNHMSVDCLEQYTNNVVNTVQACIHEWWKRDNPAKKVKALVKKSDESTLTPPCYRPTTGIANIQGIEEYALAYKNDKFMELITDEVEESMEKEKILRDERKEYEDLFAQIAKCRK